MTRLVQILEKLHAWLYNRSMVEQSGARRLSVGGMRPKQAGVSLGFRACSKKEDWIIKELQPTELFIVGEPSVGLNFYHPTPLAKEAFHPKLFLLGFSAALAP